MTPVPSSTQPMQEITGRHNRAGQLQLCILSTAQFSHQPRPSGVVWISRQRRETKMSKLTAALVAVVFAAGAVTGTPAWADRGFGRYDRGHPVNHFPAAHHRDRGGNGWAIGLGLLAGTAILLAATQPSSLSGLIYILHNLSKVCYNHIQSNFRTAPCQISL